MAIICCCPQLRHKKKPPNKRDATQDQEPQGLATRPPPARLPPPASNGVPLSPQSTVARSSLTDPLPGAEADASVHLAELVIEESEDDNGDDGLNHTNRNRSTSTLAAVKARIRRHLSQDSIPHLSESEEQIARRAEVKRLIRKRIQEELQSENNPSKPQHPDPASIASVTVLGNGPRDTIEFTVDEVKNKELARVKAAYLSKSSESDDNHVLSALPKRSSARSIGKEHRNLDSSPVSLRDRIDNDVEAAHFEQHRHVRQRSSLPEIPTFLQLQAPRVASLQDAGSLTSWRISLGADKLADLLTPDKSQSLFRPVASPVDSRNTHEAKSGNHQPLRRMRSKSSPLVERTADVADKFNASQTTLYSDYRRKRIPKSSSLVRDESPVGLWLRAQGEQFRQSTASPVQSERQSEDEAVSQNRSSPSGRPCADNSFQTQPDLCVCTRDSQGAPRKRQAACTHLLIGDEMVGKSSSKECAVGFNPSNCSPVEISFTATRSEVSQTSMTLDAASPAQNTIRKGLNGIRLPTFRCELFVLFQHWAFFFG